MLGAIKHSHNERNENMTQYTLNIQFDDQGLKQVNAAQQKVTIVKQVPNGSPVAWVLFEPEETNVITWEEIYSVYASATNIQNGATIVTSSTAPASGGNTYTFKASQFGAGVPGINATDMAVYNQDAAITIDGVEEITSGLYQGATVNGGASASPLNAVPVLYNETATFTPIETIQVFLSNYENNGLVITDVISNDLIVTYTTNPSQSIYFDDATNTFQPGSLPSPEAMKTRRRAFARAA